MISQLLHLVMLVRNKNIPSSRHIKRNIETDLLKTFCFINFPACMVALKFYCEQTPSYKPQREPTYHETTLQEYASIDYLGFIVRTPPWVRVRVFHSTLAANIFWQMSVIGVLHHKKIKQYKYWWTPFIIAVQSYKNM